MPWPTNKPNTAPLVNLSTSRTEITTSFESLNNIIDFVDTTGIQDGYVLVYSASTDTLVAAPQSGAGGGSISDSNVFTVGLIDSTNTTSARVEHREDDNTVEFGIDPRTLGTNNRACIIVDYSTGDITVSPGNNTAFGSAFYSDGTVALNNNTTINGDLYMGTTANVAKIMSENGSNTGTLKIFNDKAETNEIRIDTSGIQLLPSSSLVLNYATWPSADGSANQVLTTDGFGSLSWTTPSGGGGGDIDGDSFNVGIYDSTGQATFNVSNFNDTTFDTGTIGPHTNQFFTQIGNPQGSETPSTTGRATITLFSNQGTLADYIIFKNQHYISGTQLYLAGIDLTLSSGNILANNGYIQTADWRSSGGANYAQITMPEPDSTGSTDIRLIPGGDGRIDFDCSTQTTVGTTGGASAPPSNPVGYINVKINGTDYVIPYYNA